MSEYIYKYIYFLCFSLCTFFTTVGVLLPIIKAIPTNNLYNIYMSHFLEILMLILKCRLKSFKGRGGDLIRSLRWRLKRKTVSACSVENRGYFLFILC